MKILEDGIREYCLTELLEMANIEPRHITYSNLTEFLNTISEYWKIKYYYHLHRTWFVNPNYYNVKYIYNEIASARHYPNASLHEIFLYAVPTDIVIKIKQTADVRHNTYEKLNEII